MRTSGQTAGARTLRSRPRPLGRLARFFGHVALLACWLLVIVMAALTWGPHLTSFKTDIVVGQSMEPTIPLYSVIVVEPVDPTRLRVGDIVSFQEPDMPSRKVTHRIQQVHENADGTREFITKGDSNAGPDPWRVRYKDDAYLVRTHAPHVGWLMIKAQTRWARVLLVALPVLLLLGGALRWIWRTDEPESSDAVLSEWQPSYERWVA